jgi:pimeloyl-ACP methyl ester carboxylesterase
MTQLSRSTQAPRDAFLEAWFGGGERLAYDPQSRRPGDSSVGLRVFVRREGDVSHAVSFLPGFPDGSIGWANVRPFLPDAVTMPKLFVDYLGMGDSDKPKGYRYSTAERTDLIEALWRDLGVRSTTLVAFDFSSLVVLEHLRRRLERLERGEPEGGPRIRGVFIFNGGLFTDGHSHPWFTTPILRLPGGGVAPWLSRYSFSVFKNLAAVMWSRGYRVQDDEVRHLFDAMNRHDGLSYLSRAAGFVADHQTQRDRLDFGALYRAYCDQFPFLVGGSTQDPFEHRQVALSEERLGPLGLRVERLPGGHLTTSEQPEALARLIADFEQQVASGNAVDAETRTSRR